MSLWATNGVPWPSVEAYRDAAIASLAQLEPLYDHGPLKKRDLPLVAVVKNEAALIDAFLAHYRRLGVTRFMIVDNGSDDGTRERLSGLRDVDLWLATASYKAANNGGFWADGLLSARALDRWVVKVDVDEFLVFAGMGRRNGLRRLIATLSFKNQSRLFAPMLDVYASGPIREARIAPQANPLDALCWFDAGPEIHHEDERGVWTVGGARRRLFFAEVTERRPGLSKYPLLIYDRETAFIGCHTPTPYGRNRLRPYARLLHCKLHAGLLDAAERAVREKQYWEDAIEYVAYRDILSSNRSLTAMTSESLRYAGPMSLVEAGLMHDPRLSFRERLSLFAQRVFRRGVVGRAAPAPRSG